jgi:hypothetical protein
MGCGLDPSSWQPLVRWFGPEEVVASERWASAAQTAPPVDDRPYARLLSRHVRAGAVDYAALKADRQDLDAFLAALAAVDLGGQDRDHRLALVLNAYNAFTLALILDHYPLASIRDIPEAERWLARRFVLGGQTVSLDALEHGWARAEFDDPRVHFALNCASVGCPPLRAEPYRAADLDAQLQDQARRVHEDPRWLEVDPASGEVDLTRLYLWYASDFGRHAPDALAFAARYRPELASGAWTVRWLPYDWSLNEARSPL